ncbi:MAG TPA: hypothetical protein VHX38_20800 [Pseudonocardiaceae bacterium]|jgi:hypothetical protein|nr:hypothetical protein [Pseudonocardiaceae bacterium]
MTVHTVNGTAGPDDTTSNATRLMCAGAYLNAVFRKNVIKELVTDRFRVVAPAYGYDTVAVLGHALAARNLRRQQLGGTALGIIVLFVLAFTGLLNVAATVLAIVWLAWAGVYLRRLATLDVLMSRLKVRENERESFNGQYPRSRTLDAGLVAKITEEQLRNSGIVHYGGFTPFVGAGIPMRDWTNAQLILQARPADLNGVRELAKSVGIGAGVAAKLRDLGIEIDTGSGAYEAEPGTLTQVVTDEDERRLIPFTVKDLLDHTHRQLLDDLREQVPAEVRISGLTVERRRYRRAVFMAPRRRGRAERDADAFISRTDSDDRYDAAREYLCVQIGSWDQELVTSMFVGFDLKGKTLHSEFYTYLLTPINGSFHLVDRLPDSLTAPFMGRVAWEMIKGSPGLLAKPFVWLIRKARNAWRRARRTGLVVDSSELRLARYAMKARDRGALRSIREMAADEDYHHFFQQTDTTKYTQVVERTLLKAIETFLRDHNVDLGDLQMIQANIVSNQDNSEIQFGDRVESGNIVNNGNRSYSINTGGSAKK